MYLYLCVEGSRPSRHIPVREGVRGCIECLWLTTANQPVGFQPVPQKATYHQLTPCSVNAPRERGVTCSVGGN